MRNGERIALAIAAAAVAAAAIASETLSFGYDARGRLVKVQHNGSVNANAITNYSYEKADNRTLKNTTGAQ